MRTPSNARFRTVPALLACALLGASVGCGGSGDGDATPTPLKTGAGVPDGDPATATIGAAGGTLVAADAGLTITVPAGALARDTALSVTPLASPAGNAVATYRLEPEGTTFAKPVTLAFHAADAGVRYAGLGLLVVAVQQADGTWRWLPEAKRDATAKTITVETTHFSNWSMLQGVMLEPHATTVEVEGAKELRVVACLDPFQFGMITGDMPDPVPEEPPLIFECLPVYPEGSSVDRWSVDGVEGGDGTHGKIQENGAFGAIFDAPDKKPDPDTVAVTTRFLYGYKNLQDLLVGYVTITDNDKYFGSFIVTAAGAPFNWTGTGDAKWTLGSPYEYTVKGTVRPDKIVYEVPNGTCTLIGGERPFTFQAGSLQTEPGPPKIFWGIGPVDWGATCCDKDGGNCQTGENFLNLTWTAGCGQYFAELDEAEYEKTGALKGTYTWPSQPCMPVMPGMTLVTVEWLFLPYTTP